MRRLSLVVFCLAALLCLSACASPAVPTESGRADSPPQGGQERSALPEPETGKEPVPYNKTVASITPRRRERILEKQKENSDAMGWLVVPGTTIDDITLLNPPGNNSYYTTHDFSRQPNRDGAYGIDSSFHLSGAKGSLSRNTTLYAHNHDDNPDGILFAQLKKYKDPDFAKAHPYLFFSTTEADMAWEVFAVFDATTDLPYILPGVYWSSFAPLLDAVYAASIYDYSVTVSENDKLLTLSTCTFSVPGHDSMPVDIPNEYRFVVMARLAGPEEEINKQAALTIRDSPLAPDDIPSFSYLTHDVFMLNGLEYGNGWAFFEGDDCIEPIHPDKLEPAGEILQSNLNDPFGDWQATQLPVGTVLYQDPEYPDVFVADMGWAKIPYIAYREERELRSVWYLLQNREGVIADKSLAAERFDENKHLERLAPLIDMTHFTPLPDDPEAIRRSGDQEEIRLGIKNSLATFYQAFFLGVPESVEKEVLIIRQSDGCYYGDAALYPQLKELLNSLFG